MKILMTDARITTTDIQFIILTFKAFYLSYLERLKMVYQDVSIFWGVGTKNSMQGDSKGRMVHY